MPPGRIRQGIGGLQVIEPRHERGYPYWHAVARVLVRAKGLPEPMYLASVHFAPAPRSSGSPRLRRSS
jgi:hypothetical protein